MTDEPIMKSVWKGLDEEGKVRRQSNRERSTALLAERAVPFETRNHGAHLIVRDQYDFWPGTGLWSHRASKASGRGVFGLLKHMDA